ncbi:hypothetical protein EUTSA_v10029309mg [Eutrema salsugineum]|uniref:RING-type E3 ubiquitin transferase n=1 Tax=Eutrema salsugineum TaxID=72664 RepID=V4KKG6_EUTSA|nr:hypothetical protein EUTSA_v10029309mg [Eutrema salsugineum]
MTLNHRKMLVPYLPGKDFNLTIFIPCFQTYPPPPPPLQKDLFLVLICISGSVLLLLFLVVFLYLYITQSRRRSSAAAVAPGESSRREDENEAGERDLSGYHHVDSITVFGFIKGEGIIDGTECSVCLNEFEEDESLGLLPKCSNCPLCRAPVLVEPRHLETETNHQSESGSKSGSSNDPNGEQESSRSRNANVLPRVQSDSASHCGSGSLETVRRSFSIGGSSSLKNWG